ncbi:hypothetical protein [Aureliella helgolandensis]|uniref:Uncharacterized protein n=1 Tax=Aureliella helgolandensis TaxID=2527968 RepID=A0A518G4F3_9BACT|nr:hypothetical protein [Aureliella helgolandensis]QDV23430.1 hypothetical protein Q31a_17280 [Aureliella helgolandensis]
MLPISDQITIFTGAVSRSAQGFNRISGKLLDHLITLAGGPGKLGDNPDAECLRLSSQHAGTKGRTVELNQSASVLLLKKAGVKLEASSAATEATSKTSTQPPK